MACNIEVACDNVTDMLGVVDAVIIARDDWPNHFDLASPFLKTVAMFLLINR